MNVTEAVTSRRSIRAFTDQPVDQAILRRILETAQRSPSGGNLQPWNAAVLTGEALQQLIAAVAPDVAKGRAGMSEEYDIYPKGLGGEYEDSRAEVGEAMYSDMGVARDDKAGRLKQFLSNYSGFGAPVMMFIHTPRYMGPPQWADIGMWMQTVMLLLREAGLDSCAQEAWAAYAQPVRRALSIPDDHIFFCGMAIGYRDADAPINIFDVPRRPLESNIDWRGF